LGRRETAFVLKSAFETKLLLSLFGILDVYFSSPMKSEFPGACGGMKPLHQVHPPLILTERAVAM